RVVLALEREPASTELHRELHRLIHVVKGASRSAGIVEIEASCHALETLLAAVEPGAAVPPEMLVSAIGLIDQLQRARAQLAAGVAVDLSAPVDVEPAPDHDPTVRVAARDLDLMMSHSAAILVARQGLADPIQILDEVCADLGSRKTLDAHHLIGVTRKLAGAARALTKSHRELDVASNYLEEEVRRIRLRSISDACQGCERIVHDTAASVGKEVDLIIVGAGVRIDRAQVDVLKDVLIQLVRNSVAHGIEMPDERRRLGKQPRGNLTIEAAIVGEIVRVTVSDDGHGLDIAAIRQSSTARGIKVESLEEAKRAIFAPGLSTAASVTELAGRGVGLDVAKQRIEALHGSIVVDSVPGQSTTFRIELPTTVATISAFLISVGSAAYAVPSSAIDRAIRVIARDVRHAEGRALVRVGEDWLPVAALATILGDTAKPLERSPAIVLGHGGHRAVLLVDHITGMLDVAVGALDARLGRVRHITGQARMPSGEIALVLNPGDVVDDLLGMTVAPPARTTAAKRRRILVVDDSATTRTLEANILRTAGYDVVLAVDGEAAMRLLSDNLAVDLIVSDVDMPNLDGFGLTQAVRGLERLAT
ncbi:MAG TPA: ATP-binding protein, partial [Kofleriaceae bacterium]